MWHWNFVTSKSMLLGKQVAQWSAHLFLELKVCSYNYSQLNKFGEKKLSNLFGIVSNKVSHGAMKAC